MVRCLSNQYSQSLISSSGSAQSKASFVRNQLAAEQQAMSKLEEPLNVSIWSNIKIGQESQT